MGSDYVMREKREMKNVPATDWAYKDGDEGSLTDQTEFLTPI
jgi:hypothetical protein